MIKKVNYSILVLMMCFSISYAQKKPNVIVVLADDIGVGDISHYRKMHTDKIILETPNIDKLAKQGMVFTNAHAPAALCATSRYAIMTGNSNFRSITPWGIWSGYAQSSFTEDQMTLGKIMKQANYTTGFLGKWHLGTSFVKKSNPSEIFDENRGGISLDVDISKIVAGGPTQNGFDYNFTLPSGIQNVPYAAYENDQWFPLKKNSTIKIIDKPYLATLGLDLNKKEGLGDSNWDPHQIGPLLVGKAVDFISTNAKKEKPFFMYYCSQAVHEPHAPPAELNGIKIAGTTPSKHMDMIKELDVQIGMMIAELKKQGIYENTVFIFTSDNGGLHTDKVTLKSGHEPSDIYRGSKNDPHEGGHRVPFIAVWPNKIKANQSFNEPILGLDILATLSGITNTKIPKTEAMDSYNLLPVLTGKEKSLNRPFVLIQGGSNKEVLIVEGDWKLIIQMDKKDKTDKIRTPVALFNLKDNITENEKFNFVNDPKYKDLVNKLFEKYNSTRDSKVFTGKHL